MSEKQKEEILDEAKKVTEEATDEKLAVEPECEAKEEGAVEDTAEPVIEEVSQDPTKDEDKKSFFKKKDKKDKKDEKIEELTDQVKRQMAEFDNFRKRTEKEKAQMFETGAKNVIEKILPVIDNFERGLMAVPEEEKENAFIQGMDMVYKQMMTELETIGVKVIESVGTEFNPKFHNAVMQVESEEFESGVVAQELQKGYIYRDTVIRHSMVAVVQ